MSSDQKELVRLTLGEDDDADSGDEEEDTEDLEREVVMGEERVADEMDIGELAVVEGDGDLTFRADFLALDQDIGGCCQCRAVECRSDSVGCAGEDTGKLDPKEDDEEEGCDDELELSSEVGS